MPRMAASTSRKLPKPQGGMTFACGNPPGDECDLVGATVLARSSWVSLRPYRQGDYKHVLRGERDRTVTGRRERSDLGLEGSRGLSEEQGWAHTVIADFEVVAADALSGSGEGRWTAAGQECKEDQRRYWKDATPCPFGRKEGRKPNTLHDVPRADEPCPLHLRNLTESQGGDPDTSRTAGLPDTSDVSIDSGLVTDWPTRTSERRRRRRRRSAEEAQKERAVRSAKTGRLGEIQPLHPPPRANLSRAPRRMHEKLRAESDVEAVQPAHEGSGPNFRSIRDGYGAEVVKRFGGLRVLGKKFLATGLVQLFGRRGMRW
ncbi:hypothetical protein HO173_008896 [Letharia columbiana]|uniref:Uncharacterized protein n=1 Tax=Letharia columbiana TaxID=112416 RepID=A0A8H6FQP8_9LECA|nr:uncharacterized protein HO173_008896 [Letharia columbiana]KAF6232933.1 hypothetical protein HO173_008896 [Letharia columbiana]